MELSFKLLEQSGKALDSINQYSPEQILSMARENEG